MHEIGEDVGVMPTSLCISSLGLPMLGVYLQLSFRGLPLSYWDCFTSRNWERKVYISPGCKNMKAQLPCIRLGHLREQLTVQSFPAGPGWSHLPWDLPWNGTLTWLPLLSCPVSLTPLLASPGNTSLISYLHADPCLGSAFGGPHWRHYLKNKNSLDSHRWEGICNYH